MGMMFPFHWGDVYLIYRSAVFDTAVINSEIGTSGIFMSSATILSK
jgi:hypothetical protein